MNQLFTNWLHINTSLDTPSRPQALWTQPSCISTLPIELLLEVFHVATFDVNAPNVMPATLSHVSKLWQDLVLHTPALWAKILVVEDLGPDLKNFHKTIDRVRFFLGRSAAHALDLYIELRTYKSGYITEDSDHPFHAAIDQFRECTKSISSLLAPHIGRVKYFNLVCDEFKSICDIQSCFSYVPMMMLEDVRVYQLYERDIDNILYDEMESSVFSVPLGTRRMDEEIYPKLRHAVLSAIPMDWHRFSPSNLQTLEMSFLPMQARPDGETLRQVLLANEHSLESLTIHNSGPMDYALHPYVMSKLRHLELGYACPSEPILLIRCLRVPNLVTLNITDLRVVPERRNTHYDPTVSVLFQALIDNFPLHQVKQLVLQHISFMPEMRLLRSYPDVQLVPNLSVLPIPATPLHFLLKLMTLKSLTIINPDPGTLHALNFLPTPIRGKNLPAVSQFTHLPVPALDFLYLADFNLSLVGHFISVRLKYHSSFRRFRSLMFSIPTTYIIDPDPLFLLTDCVELSDGRFDIQQKPT